MCLWVAKFNLVKDIPEDKAIANKLKILKTAIDMDGWDSIRGIMTRYNLPVKDISNGFLQGDCDFLGILSIVFVEKIHWNSVLQIMCFGKVKSYYLTSNTLEILYQGKMDCKDYFSAIVGYSVYFSGVSIEKYSEEDPVYELKVINLNESRVMTPSEEALRKVLSCNDTEADLDVAVVGAPIKFLGKYMGAEQAKWDWKEVYDNSLGAKD